MCAEGQGECTRGWMDRSYDLLVAFITLFQIESDSGSSSGQGTIPFQCSVDVLDKSLPWTSVERSHGKEARGCSRRREKWPLFLAQS